MPRARATWQATVGSREQVEASTSKELGFANAPTSSEGSPEPRVGLQPVSP